MTRYLPPLLLLALTALIVITALGRPTRPRARETVDFLVADRFRRAEAAEAIDRYLARFGGVEDRWFAMERYLQVRYLHKALDLLLADGRPSPEATRRFARLALWTIGWEEPQRDTPTGLQFRTVPILAEGGDAKATEFLQTIARSYPMPATGMYLLQGMRYTGHDGVAPVVRGYREKGDGPARAAAAFATFGHGPLVPQAVTVDGDLELLLAMLAQERMQHRDAWAASAFALGRSGEPRALEALRSQATRLGELENERARADRLLVLNGLNAGGSPDTDQLDLLEDALQQPRLDVELLAWYVDLVVQLVLQGQPEAPARLQTLWTDIAARSPGLELRIVQRLALSAEAPPRDDPRVADILTWIEADLERRSHEPLAQVLRMGLRLRQGETGAMDRIYAWMKPYVRRMVETPAARRGALADTWIEALRIIWLFGDGSAHQHKDS